MNAETTKKDWRVGELVTLGQSTTLLKKNGTKSYSSVVSSHYVCVREATERQQGILVKVLGETRRERVLLVSGKPFCKDERDELFVGKHYYCFPFPQSDELKEILDIIRSDTGIQQKLVDNGMSINLNGTFWVNDTTSLFLGLKRSPQYYDPSTGRLATAKNLDERHQRLTIAYF